MMFWLRPGHRRMPMRGTRTARRAHKCIKHGFPVRRRTVSRCRSTVDIDRRRQPPTPCESAAAAADRSNCDDDSDSLKSIKEMLDDDDDGFSISSSGSEFTLDDYMPMGDGSIQPKLRRAIRHGAAEDPDE
mmetsp:Transcript_1295/g.2854  ORF Transcript_1295/g.2854 Transcript_1295/m.2854 type:complete len:131 (+) Transcript_1295:54-446(+)